MLVLPQQVTVKWNPTNRKHFEPLGYSGYVRHNELVVNVLDLPITSKDKVKFICDYCFKEKSKEYRNHIRCTTNGIIKKDACGNRQCQLDKQKESNLVKYGVDSTNKLSFVLDKKRKKLALPEDEVRKVFEELNYIMIGKYINAATPLEYICKKHFDKGTLKISYSHLKSGERCKYCAIEARSGENHHNWSGGKTSLCMYLRDQLRCWTFDSLKATNFTCVITGSKKKIEVHHHRNFKDIVIETLRLLGLPYLKSYHFYQENDLLTITEKCKELHYYYGLGTPLRRDIHKMFHSIYGKKNNSMEQLIEFISDIKSNKVLIENEIRK